MGTQPGGVGVWAALDVVLVLVILVVQVKRSRKRSRMRLRLLGWRWCALVCFASPCLAVGLLLLCSDPRCSSRLHTMQTVRGAVRYGTVRYGMALPR